MFDQQKDGKQNAFAKKFCSSDVETKSTRAAHMPQLSKIRACDMIDTCRWVVMNFEKCN